MAWTPRSTAPDVSIKYYRHPGYSVGGVDGVNDCLLIDSNTGFVMPNCVGYSWGRWYEAFGSRPTLSQGDACTWYGYTADGYQRSLLIPQVGAQACLEDNRTPGSGGHIMTVEYVLGGTLCITSNSAYNGALFWMEDLTFDSNLGTWVRQYDSSYYDFQGFILPPEQATQDWLLLATGGQRRFPNGRGRIINNRRY